MRRMMLKEKNELKSEWDVEWYPSHGELTDIGFTSFFNAGRAELTEEHLAITSMWSGYDGFFFPVKKSKKAVMEVDVRSTGNVYTFVCALGDGDTFVSCAFNGKKLLDTYEYNPVKELESDRNLVRLEYDSSGQCVVKVNGEEMVGYNGNFGYEKSNVIFSKGNCTSYIYSIKFKSY